MHKYQHGILDIIDTKTSNKIKSIIFNEFAIDLSFIEDIIFRKRLTYSLNYLQLKPNDLSERVIKINSKQLHIILHCVFPDETELFRDTDIWNFLKTNVLSKINYNKKYTVLFFNATSGEDLYSTLMLLNELKIKDNFEITLISPSKYSIENIEKGVISQPKNRTSITNFKLVFPKESMTKYIGHISNSLCFSNHLLKNINFINSLPLNMISDDFDLIFSRNKTLCFNNLIKEKLFIEISKHVKQNGYLIAGTNENIPESIINSFKTIYKNENFFKRNE